jgi:hypothetical protein
MSELIDGPGILAAIHYVRDFYGNIARMLQAADLPLADRHWTPHGQSWKAVPKCDRSLSGSEYWMPHFVVRQYLRNDVKASKELLTLAVIPHDPVDKEIEQPLCLAARVHTNAATNDDVYWLPLMQLRRTEGLGNPNQIVRIRRNDLRPDSPRLHAWDALVSGEEMISIMVPLVQIVDEGALVERLINPILAPTF